MVWLAGLGIILAVALIYVMTVALYADAAVSAPNSFESSTAVSSIDKAAMNAATAIISALLVIVLLIFAAVIGFSVCLLSVLFHSI